MSVGLYDGNGHAEVRHERLLTGVELDCRKAACRGWREWVSKSQTRGWHGRPLASIDDDLKFQTADSKADDQHVQASQKMGELNSFQLQGVHHGRISQQVPPLVRKLTSLTLVSSGSNLLEQFEMTLQNLEQFHHRQKGSAAQGEEDRRTVYWRPRSWIPSITIRVPVAMSRMSEATRT